MTSSERGTERNSAGQGDSCVSSALPDEPRLRRPYVVHERPLFFAHRGGSLLVPENTLPAFEQSVALGADALELDIQTTREGEIVVIHDIAVDRTTDGTGPVSRFTLSELRQLDAGYHFTPDGGRTFPFRGLGITVPTLREVFERFPGLRVNIDLKESTPDREQRLWKLIQQQRAEDRVLVASGDLNPPIGRFRRLTAGRVATSACPAEVRDFVLASAARVTRWLRPQYDALQVPEWHRGIHVVSPALLAAAHRRGLDVHVWTVDRAEDMRRLLAMGVDGIMTDRPDVLAEVMRADR